MNKTNKKLPMIIILVSIIFIFAFTFSETGQFVGLDLTIPDQTDSQTQEQSEGLIEDIFEMGRVIGSKIFPQRHQLSPSYIITEAYMDIVRSPGSGNQATEDDCVDYCNGAKGKTCKIKPVTPPQGDSTWDYHINVEYNSPQYLNVAPPGDLWLVLRTNSANQFSAKCKGLKLYSSRPLAGSKGISNVVYQYYGKVKSPKVNNIQDMLFDVCQCMTTGCSNYKYLGRTAWACAT